MKINIILIDFENTQPKNLNLLQGGPFKIKVFLGATQNKVPVELVTALQAFGPDAEYIQIEGNGNNALDFHIAYTIGRLAVELPGAFFHIISKDTGFDSLIRHLRKQKIFCHRSASIEEIPLLKVSSSSPVGERVDALVENLAKRKTGKPGSRQTLGSTVKALFFNQLSDGEVQALVAELFQRGFVEEVQGKLIYKLPA